MCSCFSGSVRVVLGVCVLAFPLSGNYAFAQSAAAASEIRFQQMEQEIRRLTGQIEEQNFEIRQMKQALEELRTEMDALRLRGGEGLSENLSSGVTAALPQVLDGGEPAGQNGALIPNVLGTLTQSGEGTVSSSDNAPRAYDYAYSFIKNRDFDRAEQAFAQFIEQYPDHSLVANAKYWYGETFYVRGSYEKAARLFAEGYKNYPKSQKAPDNLLKLGMALIGMGKTEDACIALKQLKQEYSDASVPILNRADMEMGRIDCT